MSQAPEPRVSGSQPSRHSGLNRCRRRLQRTAVLLHRPWGSLFFPSRCSCEIEQRGLALAREGGRSRTECWSLTSRVSDVSPTMTWTVSPHSSGLTSRALVGCPAHCCPPSSADPAKDAGPREVRDLPRGTQHGARGEPASPRQPRRPGSQQLSFMSKNQPFLGDVEGMWAAVSAEWYMQPVPWPRGWGTGRPSRGPPPRPAWGWGLS